MDILDDQPNTKAIKSEPLEVCYAGPTFTNLCEDIKIEIVENELPLLYEDINLEENFQAPKKCAKNSNVKQKIKNGCTEIPTNIEKCITDKNILDVDQSVQSTEINISELPESDDEQRIDLFFFCEICKLKCSSKKLIQVHMRLHDKSRKFECNTCGYRYKHRTDLTVHMTKHSETKFVCGTCGYKSWNKYYFNRHIKQQHREVRVDTKSHMTNNDISGSSQQYTTLLNKDNRQSQNKDGGNKLYHRCKKCPFMSFIKHTLDKHLKLHDLNRKYQCDVCLYRFFRKQEIRKHMSKHSKKKYSCRVCGRQFKYEHNVTTLMYEHEGVQYRCDMCEHVSKSKDQLSTHMSKKHNNIYKCKVCPKMFTQGSHYTAHIKTHFK